MRLIAFILFFCLAGAGFSASEACPLPRAGFTPGVGTYYSGGSTYSFVGSTSSASLTAYNVTSGSQVQVEIDDYQGSSWTVVSYSGPSGSTYDFSTVGAYCLFTVSQGGTLVLSVFDTTNSTTYYVEFVGV